MTIGEAVLAGQEGLMAIAYVSGPMLFAALVVGLAVSLLQAVTQVHEMTLVFVPKMLAVFLVMLALGGWMLEQMVAFGTNSFTSIENIEN